MPTYGGREFFIIAGPEFEATARATAKEDHTLSLKLRDRLRNEVDPLVDKAKNNVRTLRVRGHAGTTGLRQRVAAGVFVRVNPGIGVRVMTSMPQNDEAIIPRGLDRTSGWRHPVFGNREVWVRQFASKPGWFTDTLGDGRIPIERGLTDELEMAAHNIAVAGGLP